MKKKYIITNNELVYCFKEHGMVSVPKTQHNYKEILDYLLSPEFNEGKLFEMFNAKLVDIETASKGVIKNAENGSAVIGEIIIPKEIMLKITELREKGFEWKRYQKFWEQCLKNPNPKSIELLFQFLSRYNFTITEDGHFLAYKGIRNDYKDVHTGTFDNHPGNTVEMPRKDVVFDPKSHCASGLHCGSCSYAKGFGSITVLVKVDPADVVSVPEDHEAQKIRVCRYKVESVYEDCKDHGDTVVNKNNKSIKMNTDRKSMWHSEEEQLLWKLVNKASGKMKWDSVAKRLNRSKESCRKKYAQLKNSKSFVPESTVVKQEEKKEWTQLKTKEQATSAIERKEMPSKKVTTKWTEKDSKILISMHNSGKGWAEISKYLGKSANACRKRFIRIAK